MMSTVIIISILSAVMLLGYISFRHEHREEARTEAYLYRHRNDADKLMATAEVSDAYNELVAIGLIK